MILKSVTVVPSSAVTDSHKKNASRLAAIAPLSRLSTTVSAAAAPRAVRVVTRRFGYGERPIIDDGGRVRQFGPIDAAICGWEVCGVDAPVDDNYLRTGGRQRDAGRP